MPDFPRRDLPARGSPARLQRPHCAGGLVGPGSREALEVGGPALVARVALAQLLGPGPRPGVLGRLEAARRQQGLRWRLGRGAAPVDQTPDGSQRQRLRPALLLPGLAPLDAPRAEARRHAVVRVAAAPLVHSVLVAHERVPVATDASVVRVARVQHQVWDAEEDAQLLEERAVGHLLADTRWAFPK